MKKVMSVIAAAAALAVVLAGCHKSDAENETSSQDIDPTVSNSESFQNTEDSVSSDDLVDVTSTSDNSSSVTTDEPTQESTSQGSDVGNTIDSANQVVQTAEALLGIPFAENGTSPEVGFDNSGFIYYVLRENGFINCPRLTGDQAVMGTRIGFDQLKSGDLAFFSTENSGNPDFGGIYIGDGQMIYCPMPGQTVKMVDISIDYWKNAFVSGVSLS